MLRALLERDIVPDVVVGPRPARSTARSSPPTRPSRRSTSSTRRGSSCAATQVFPGGTLSPGLEPPHPRRPPLLQRGPARRSSTAATPPATFDELAIPLRVVAADLDTGDEVVFAAARSSPRCSPAPRCPGIFPPVRHDGRALVDGAVVDTVPLSHALAGPGRPDLRARRVGDLHGPAACARRSTSLIRAFAISRKQRFELELRSVPETVEVVVLPAPVDDRDLFDFSEPGALIDAAYELAEHALDDAEADRRRRTGLRRTWWRRAGLLPSLRRARSRSTAHASAPGRHVTPRVVDRPRSALRGGRREARCGGGAP